MATQPVVQVQQRSVADHPNAGTRAPWSGRWRRSDTRFGFTASSAMREKLRVAQDLLGHAIPSGDIAESSTGRSPCWWPTCRAGSSPLRPARASRGQSENSRNIPAEVKASTSSAKDGGRCTFVARNGRRCEERRFLEFHHVVPHAAGGKPTADNIELPVSGPQRYEVGRYFGPGIRRREGAAR
jgi:hypothetical protein